MTEMYSPSDVQKKLGIDASTLRKYAALLEGHGYRVHRNNRGHRVYFEKDVHSFRKLMECSKQEGMTMEQSAEAVLKWASEENSTDSTTEIEPVQNTNDQVVENNCNNEEVVVHNCNHEELMERIEQKEVSEEKILETSTETASLHYTSNQVVEHNCNHEELLEKIEHLEQINLDLIKLLKEKAVREAFQEEKINQILKHVERLDQLEAERIRGIKEETKLQIAAANHKKWWNWFTFKKS